ncbi:hypothetical protein HN51_054652, partial [Arachis hypogaea]
EPLGGLNEPAWSAGSCGSASRGPSHECSPIAKSVVSIISGLQSDLRHLSYAISRHDTVVSEIRDTIQLLMERRSSAPRVVPPGGQCASCRRDQHNRRSKVSNTTRKKDEVSKSSGICKPSRPKKQVWSPVLDTTFTVDHIPFITKRSKKGMEKPDPVSKQPRSPIMPELVDLTTDDDADKIPWQFHANQDTETAMLSARRRRGLPAKGTAAVVGIGNPVSVTVRSILKSMNLVFRPTDDMNLSGVEVAVATYIFTRALPDSEILIDTGDRHATRAVLLTLAPKTEVVDDMSRVLNTVVRMLTLASSGDAWFMPTTFMQAALGGRSLTTANVTSIRNNYMCSKVDQVTRVYQPVWCDQHWYLMIIDVLRQKLIYLDSLRDPREDDARKTAMLRVALSLEGMTLGKSWLTGPGVMRPRFSVFEFEEPDVP